MGDEMKKRFLEETFDLTDRSVHCTFYLLFSAAKGTFTLCIFTPRVEADDRTKESKFSWSRR